MMRSPIFILFFLIIIFSCNKTSKNNSDNIPKKNIQKADKLSKLGDLYYNDKKFDSAFYYYNEAKAIYEVEKDSSYLAYNSIQMARIQQTFGDYFGSEQTLTEVLPFIKNNIQYQTATNNLFGISSKELSNYEDAINYYNKVLEMSNDSLSKVTPLNNIATVYTYQKKYDEAIKILNSILKLNKLDTVPNKKALILDNLGFAYYKANQNSEGLDLMIKALSIKEKNNDTYSSIESYLHLAEYYQNANPQKSKEYAIKGYQAATTNNSIDERLESLFLLINNSSLVDAKKHTIKYASLSDSITKVRNRSKNQFAKIKYDSKKANEENLKLKTQNAESDLQVEKQKSQKYISFIGILLLLTGIIYIVSYFRNKNKRERIEATYNTETRISKKLHDELANDVFQTMAFASTQDLEDPAKKETLISNLDKIYLRTRNISKENSAIHTGEKYEANLKEMLNNFSNKTIKVIIKDNKDIDWSKIQPEKKIALHRILQELMVNMKKHSQCSFVVIGFENNNNTIDVNYSDNGIGFSNELNLKNGLQNVENRIHAINGTITFDSETDKGFKSKISFPK
jgi:signal transduction histidine kinase